MIDKLGGIKAIQAHVAVLTEYLYSQLSSLRHSNGRPMLQIFGKHHFANHRDVQVGFTLQGTVPVTVVVIRNNVNGLTV